MSWDYRSVASRSKYPSTASIRRRATGRNNWLRRSHWIIGAFATVSLSVLFLLAESSLPFWVASAFLLLVWGGWAWKHPLSAFASLIFVWVVLYTRAAIPIFQVEGGGNRGGVMVGDLLWITFAVAWLVRFVLAPRAALPIRSERVDFLLVLLFLYIGLSFVLPILGVLAGAPASFAIPGIRHLQWASFAWFGYWFAQRVSASEMLKIVFIVLSVAGLFHALYSSVQLFVFFGVLPYDWLELDRLFAQRFPRNWFFYPRTTGLFVSPNSYGMFGAVLLICPAAITFSRVQVSLAVKTLLGVCGLWALATSASRTGLTGSTGGIIAVLSAAYLKAVFHDNNQQLYKVIKFAAIASLATVGGTVLVFLFLPPVLVERFALLLLTFTEGAAADPNAIARIELWQEAIQVYEEQYPLGSWVPLSHITGKTIDSYWVTLLVQGTPVYLFVFVVFLIGMVWRGMNLAFSTTERSLIGYAGAGMGTMIGISSFTESPILQPQILVPFWILVGLLFTKSKPCAHFYS